MDNAEVKVCVEFQKFDYVRFCVKGSNRYWKVFLNDGRWLCECSVNYSRDINSNCKHIDKCKSFIERQKDLHILCNKKVQVDTKGVLFYVLKCSCGKFEVEDYVLENAERKLRRHISR